MHRKILINLVLILAVAALGVFLVNTGKEPEKQVIPLTSIAPETIRRIDIEKLDQGTIRFRKNGDVWFMTAPLEVRANENRINAMLQLLKTPSFTRLSIEELNLSRFDLAPPAITLRENGNQFFFGDTNPLEGRRYVMVGAVVHLIRDDLYPQLQQGPEFFISPQLIPEGTLLQSIELPGHTFNFLNNQWTSAEGTEISKASIDRLVTAWQTTRATRIEIIKPADSLGEVILHTRTGEIMRFEIQQRKPVLKLARSDLGITYYVPVDTASDLFPVDH